MERTNSPTFIDGKAPSMSVYIGVTASAFEPSVAMHGCRRNMGMSVCINRITIPSHARDLQFAAKAYRKEKLKSVGVAQFMPISLFEYDKEPKCKQ